MGKTIKVYLAIYCSCVMGFVHHLIYSQAKLESLNLNFEMEVDIIVDIRFRW